MTSSRICTVALLMILTLHLFLAGTQSARCCVKYSSRRVPCHKLKRYTLQSITSTCDIEAVIFQMKGGRFFCANPTHQWVTYRIQCLNKRAQK